ncbi:MAG TPA: DinB family protein [Bryobacterales bacterium]|jgi:uncharacterized damage-inducible protein DinB|nr:DinB family protein [Bryobacterales bacterium]
MNTTDLVHHTRYNAWATARVLESVRGLTPDQYTRGLGNSFGGIQGTLGHIYQADRIWFKRLAGEPTGSLAEFQPPAGRDAFEKEWLSVLDGYVSWAEKLSASDWDRVIQYRNTKGAALENPVWQIILHLINHDSYHRGQVTTMLRQLGANPVSTDLIAYYRSLASRQSA